MRCATCGFPLAPHRTICPRCGAANDTGGKPSKLRIKLPPLRAHQQQAEGTIQGPGQAQAPNQQPQQWVHHVGQAPPFFDQNAPVQPQYSPMQEPEQYAAWRQTIQPSFAGAAQPRTRPFSKTPEATYITRLRLSIAAVCVTLGGFILFLVYFMAPGILTASEQQASTTARTPASNTRATAPAHILVTATPLATVTNPGQKYIDNAQMASAVNAQTGEPATPATTFRSGQAIYVTFSVHTNGVIGAACLIWYLQDHPITNYVMSVGLFARAYSWAYYQGNGAARVEIYWASTKACTDKILAQSVDFTISG